MLSGVVLEDTMPTEGNLFGLSKQKGSGLLQIMWSSAISPSGIHNQAAGMRKTFSAAGPPRPVCIMVHLNKRFSHLKFLGLLIPCQINLLTVFSTTHILFFFFYLKLWLIAIFCPPASLHAPLCNQASLCGSAPVTQVWTESSSKPHTVVYVQPSSRSTGFNKGF